jgi:Do/DeqQ family serine protease
MTAKKSQFFKSAVSIIVGFILGALAIHFFLRSQIERRPQTPPAVGRRSTASQTDFKANQTPIIDPDDVEILQRTDDAISALAKAVMPAVVNVFTTRTITVQSPLMNDPFFRHFFRGQIRPQSRKSQSLGSGVFVTSDGYLASAYHVVEGAEQIQILTHDGRMFEAALTGSEPRADVVVLKVGGTGFTTLPFGDSESLRVGNFVMAVGNPFGMGHTVTRGIVSAVNRSGVGLNPYEDFIQTDAAINMGNSGGALVNSRGELVGINSAIISKTGGSHGIGLAIPSNLIKEVLPSLMKGERVSRGWIGVQVMLVTPGSALARQIGYDGEKGLVVTGVETGSPAETGGIQPGDVLLDMAGRELKTARDLRLAVTSRKAGEVVLVTLWRKANIVKMNVTLGEMPSLKDRPSPGP